MLLKVQFIKNYYNKWYLKRMLRDRHCGRFIVRKMQKYFWSKDFSLKDAGNLFNLNFVKSDFAIN